MYVGGRNTRYPCNTKLRSPTRWLQKSCLFISSPPSYFLSRSMARQTKNTRKHEQAALAIFNDRKSIYKFDAVWGRSVGGPWGMGGGLVAKQCNA